MNCDGYQAELPDLIYGELDPEARPLVLDHRRDCAACDALTRELEQVKGALPPLRPPPLLAARLKLAARDELLDRRGVADGPPPPPLSSVLRLVSVVVLAACVGVIGFALGVSSRPSSPGSGDEPRLTVPRTATDVGTTPAWVDPEPPRAPPRVPPRSPEAWQRVLFDSAVGLREQGDARQAAEFFLRAISVAPEGPMAAAAMVGRAEALLQLGERAEAATLLEEARRGILGGRLVGGPTLLQRIAELSE